MNVMSRIEKIAHETPGVKHTVAIAGQSILLGANSPNFGAMYVMLDDFHDARRAGFPAKTIAARLEERFQRRYRRRPWWASSAPRRSTAWAPRAASRSSSKTAAPTACRPLQSVGEQIVDDGRSQPDELRGMFSSFRADTPWLFLDINRDQAKTLGLSISDVFNSLQVFLGSLYVNDFNWFGRTWQVNVQAERRFRQQIRRHQATQRPQRRRADGAAEHDRQRARR